MHDTSSVTTNAWLVLLVAGLLETVWAVALKSTDGFRRPLPSVIVLVTMAASMYLLSLSARTLPIGTAYAAWTGIGVLGASMLGVLALGERLTVGRAFFLLLLVIALAGLRLTGPAASRASPPAAEDAGSVVNAGG